MTDESARSRETPARKPRPASPVFNLPAPKSIKESDTSRSVLTKARIIKIEGAVTQEMANAAISDLLYLEAIDPGKPITMLINSPGGSVSHGWAIVDMMNMITSPVHTCAIGQAASMGATILLAGAKGHRSATPNTRIMIHEASMSGVGGQADDVAISSNELAHTKARMLEFYAMTSGASRKTLVEKMGRDYYMYSAEALELGIIDKIAGYPECKAAFNEAAQKSNEAHHILNKNRPNLNLE